MLALMILMYNFIKILLKIFLLNSYYNSKFDLVISNILALPLIELSTQISNLMNKNGYLVLSGFLDN